MKLHEDARAMCTGKAGRKKLAAQLHYTIVVAKAPQGKCLPAKVTAISPPFPGG